MPRLKGVEVGGRTAVLFSREDLTAGMVGQDVDGVFGYTPAVATAIMRNVALYASGGQPAAPADDAVAGAGDDEDAEAEDGADGNTSAKADEEEDESDGEMKPTAAADEDGEDEEAAAPRTKAGKPKKPVERITGDIDVEAELADKDADDRAARKGKSGKQKKQPQKKVAEPE